MNKNIKTQNEVIMKKQVKLLLSVVLIINLIIMSSCKIENAKLYFTEDLVYCHVSGAGATNRSKNGEYVAILRLTEVGKTKDVIIIPDEIDGRPVVQIGMRGLTFKEVFGEGGIMSSVYLPKSLVIDACSKLYDEYYAGGDSNKIILIKFRYI